MPVLTSFLSSFLFCFRASSSFFYFLFFFTTNYNNVVHICVQHRYSEFLTMFFIKVEMCKKLKFKPV